MIWREFRLDAARSNFERSGNPYHVWGAINFCAEHKIPFPPWVIAYLNSVFGAHGLGEVEKDI